MKNETITNSLAHTSWNCKYHIVFAPKYRRKVFYGEKRREIGKILRELCGWKGVNIIEAEVCIDHVHMLVEIPPKMSVAGFVGFLKGKSSLLIYQKWANMKYKYRNREFWCRGYYVDTVTYFYGHSLYDTIQRSDVSPFVCVCSTVKSESQRQKFVTENF